MNSVLILSGAGLSAESGIRTFRDSDGLWEEYDVMEVCSAAGFKKDREHVLNFYDERRKDLENRVPNSAHLMIAELQRAFHNSIVVQTQNVDDLLEKAGCTDVVHLHGTLRDLRCESCGHIWDIGYGSIKGHTCPICKSALVRHNVVMFNEPAPEYQTLYKAIEEYHHGLFVAIGTSGQVIDVGGIARYFKYSVLNNRDPEPWIDGSFSKVIHKKATEAAPEIMKTVNIFLRSGKID